MDDKQLENIYLIITDVWNMIKEFRQVRADDSYWQALHARANELYDKHGRQDISQRFIAAAVLYLDNLFQVRQKGGTA